MSTTLISEGESEAFSQLEKAQNSYADTRSDELDSTHTKPNFMEISYVQSPHKFTTFNQRGETRSGERRKEENRSNGRGNNNANNRRLAGDDCAQRERVHACRADLLIDSLSVWPSRDLSRRVAYLEPDACLREGSADKLKVQVALISDCDEITVRHALSRPSFTALQLCSNFISVNHFRFV
jgi:hypothetical protein